MDLGRVRLGYDGCVMVVALNRDQRQKSNSALRTLSQFIATTMPGESSVNQEGRVRNLLLFLAKPTSFSSPLF